MKEYKSFYKEVTGNEGGKCRYNKRLDTYGCGCAHDCSYCYANPCWISGACGTLWNRLWQVWPGSSARLQSWNREPLSAWAE